MTSISLERFIGVKKFAWSASSGPAPFLGTPFRPLPVFMIRVFPPVLIEVLDPSANGAAMNGLENLTLDAGYMLSRRRCLYYKEVIVLQKNIF
jgi:hypothetical protein